MTPTLAGSRWLTVPAPCRRACLLTLAREVDSYPHGKARDMAALLVDLPPVVFDAIWSELVAMVDVCDLRADAALDALVGES